MKKYHTLKWLLEVKGMPNNFVKGYEVFTSKKAADEYAENLRKDDIIVWENSHWPGEFTEWVNGITVEPKTIKENIFTVESKGLQFH